MRIVPTMISTPPSVELPPTVLLDLNVIKGIVPFGSSVWMVVCASLIAATPIIENMRSSDFILEPLLRLPLQRLLVGLTSSSDVWPAERTRSKLTGYVL